MRISIDPDEEIAFIPESERDCDNPLTVYMKYVPLGKVQKYGQLIAAKARNSHGMSPESALSQAQYFVQKKQFTDSVSRVENFSIGKRKVTDPGEFYDGADAALIYEIIAAMENGAKLTAGQRKNFEGDSDTSSNVQTQKETPHSIVPNAQKEIKKSETALTGDDYPTQR